MAGMEPGDRKMAEYFTIDTTAVYSAEPEHVEVVLEANDKLKNKGGDDLDEILNRKCPSGWKMHCTISILVHAVEAV